MKLIASNEAVRNGMAMCWNGIGFCPDFNEHIFKISQRLNGVGLYSGNRVGLSSEKIAENHHGKVFTESAEEKGSIFNVILPYGNLN